MRWRLIASVSAFIALAIALTACATPASQPRADTVFGPNSTTAMLVIFDHRLLTLRRVNLDTRTTGEEVYRIGGTRIAGQDSWLDVREVVPGDYALHMMTADTGMGIYVTCLARAAPVYRVRAGEITVIRTAERGGGGAVSSDQTFANFAAARTRFPNMIGEPREVEPIAAVQMSEHAGYLAGCPANPTFSVLDLNTNTGPPKR